MIDSQRLTELERVMGTDLKEIVSGLLRTMSESISRIGAASAAGDLAGLARAAHTCRNDALLVRASDLLAALEAVEQAARYEETAAAQAAVAQVDQTWPPVRAQLEQLANP